MSEQQKYHLAQLNVARALAPMESPVMAGFVARLDEINTLAEKSAGFVWRLKDDTGNATSIRAFDDDLILVNLSMWQDIESLHNYTYRSVHAELFKNKKAWFSAFGKPHLVLWWVPAGHQPTALEAKERLEYLQEHGPTAHAFTFLKRFSPEGEPL